MGISPQYKKFLYKLEINNNKLIYNRLFLMLSITFLTTAFSLSSIFTLVSAFAQSEWINQTMQNISKSTNQTIQNTNQSVNETTEAVPFQENVTDFGANITEGAKDLVGNMGEGIQNFSSGNLSLIL